MALTAWSRKPSGVRRSVSYSKCHLVKAYLADIREEQLKKRVTPRQAEPILLGDLAVISGYLKAMLLNSSNLSPIQIFIYVRDQALFKALFFFCWRSFSGYVTN